MKDSTWKCGDDTTVTELLKHIEGLSRQNALLAEELIRSQANARKWADKACRQLEDLNEACSEITRLDLLNHKLELRVSELDPGE